MNEPYMMPVEQRPFNVLEAMIGVFLRPVTAMRAIAAARPWGVALAILIVLSALSVVIGFTIPLQPVPEFPPEADVPPAVTTMLTAMSRRGPLLAISLLGPVFQVLYIGILFLVARMLGGQGRFSALFATIGFAALLGLLSLPFTLAANLLNITFVTLMSSLVSIAIGIWAIVLQVIAIRESMHFSTGRAVVTWLIPLAVGLFLSCVLFSVFFGALIYALSSATP